MGNHYEAKRNRRWLSSLLFWNPLQKSESTTFDVDSENHFPQPNIFFSTRPDRPENGDFHTGLGLGHSPVCNRTLNIALDSLHPL